MDSPVDTKFCGTPDYNEGAVSHCHSVALVSHDRHFFAQARDSLQQLEREREQTDGGGATDMNWNMVVTGSPGVGKTTFSRLVSKFLRAYGVLASDTFVEKNGLDLKAEYEGQTAPMVAEMFKEAKEHKRLGNIFLIRLVKVHKQK